MRPPELVWTVWCCACRSTVAELPTQQDAQTTWEQHRMSQHEKEPVR